MNVEFYTITNDNRTINKTLNNPTVLNCNIRTDIDIYNPRLLLKQWNTAFNYFKWDNRYYFILDCEYTAKNLYEVQSHIDVLMTYKTKILNANCLISQSTDINPYFDGGDYNSLETVETEVIKSDTKMEKVFNTVLLTLGVSI